MPAHFWFRQRALFAFLAFFCHSRALLRRRCARRLSPVLTNRSQPLKRAFPCPARLVLLFARSLSRDAFARLLLKEASRCCRTVVAIPPARGTAVSDDESFSLYWPWPSRHYQYGNCICLMLLDTGVGQKIQRCSLLLSSSSHEAESAHRTSRGGSMHVAAQLHAGKRDSAGDGWANDSGQYWVWGPRWPISKQSQRGTSARRAAFESPRREQSP